MNPNYHRELQQARRRIARNRLAVQRDLLGVTQSVQHQVNAHLQSQRHPLALLLGAVGLGVVVSRLLSNFSGTNNGWEQTLFRWAKTQLRSGFWRHLIQLWSDWRHPQDEDDSSDSDDQPEAAS